MSATVPFDDSVSRFVFEHGAVRGALVSLDDTCADILACHDYPPALARVLAELLGAAALLASALKFNGSLVVQLQGHGPVRLLVVECNAGLALRATAQWDASIATLPDDATLAALAGGPAHGRLAITLDPKDGGPIYQGIVALEASGIGELIEHYLGTSEQIASRMRLACEDGRVRGLLLQRMPGANDSDEALWQCATATAATVSGATLLQAPTPAALLRAIFPEHDVRLFKPHAARFSCSCSRQRVENALRLVGRGEVDDILAEQGRVSVACEFCNRTYAFTPSEAQALFAQSQPGPDTPGRTAVRH